MKPVPRMACLFYVFTALALTGCMETLELVGELAEEPSEGEYAEEECDPAPLSCRKDRPTEAYLRIQVSSPFPSTVTVYHGDFEDGRVAWSGPPTGRSFTTKLPLGTYSATADYARGGKTIIAVDGDYLDYSSMSTCDGSCYETLDGVVDLELEH